MISGPTKREFRGCLEQPTDRYPDRSALIVVGWVFSTTSKVSAVEVAIDGGRPQELLYGIPRPDVAALNPESSAAASGFRGHIPLQEVARNDRIRVEIFATLADGRRESCFDRIVFTTDKVSSALVRADWLLRGAALKAWFAFREGRLPASPAWWAKALVLHWRETAQRPTRVSEPEALNQARVDDSYRHWLPSRPGTPSFFPALPADAPVGAPAVDICAFVDCRSELRALVRSIELQRRGINWRLWLACSDEGAHRAALSLQPPGSEGGRIRVGRMSQWIREEGSWLPPGESPHVVLLDSTSVLAPDALLHVVRALSTSDQADWIYTDDDWLDSSGSRRDPYLKGAFSLQLAAVDDYATRLAVVRRATIEQVGGLRREYGNAQIYELLLRVATTGSSIKHLPEVCCHRVGRIPAVLSADHHLATERTLFTGQARVSIRVEASVPSGALQLQRVAWKTGQVDAQAVTIVIPTRDRLDLLRACVESIRRTVQPSKAQLLVVDDHSQQEATLEYLEALERDRRLPCRIIRPPRAGHGFNYARLMNIAAREVETSLMLHLNNDIEAIVSGWLEQMTGWMSIPDVGVVGAKLLFPDGSIQHAGVVVSPGSGVLEHFQGRLLADDPGYQWLPHRVREVSAVTGACLLTRTDLFKILGGFDEQNLAVQFNDIDFCLRMREGGKRIVYEPGAVLYHQTSATRGREYDYEETLFFLKKYSGYRDPFVSPHLDPISLCGPTPTLIRPREGRALFAR